MTDPTEIPAPPATLPVEYHPIWRDITGQWAFGPGDLLVLEGAIRCWGTYLRAQQEVDEAGSVMVCPEGGIPRVHPGVKVALDCARESRLAFAQLKLEPPEDLPAVSRFVRGGIGVTRKPWES